MFKKMRGVHLPYRTQGLIFFTCLNYQTQPPDVQHKIVNACLEVGKDNYQALFEFLTTDHGAQELALKHYIDATQLYRLRREFYEKFADN